MNLVYSTLKHYMLAKCGLNSIGYHGYSTFTCLIMSTAKLNTNFHNLFTHLKASYFIFNYFIIIGFYCISKSVK